jgi:predicted ester cyclase
MSAEKNKALIQQAFAAWNAGDAEFENWARQSVAPTVTVDFPTGKVTGLDAFLAYFQSIRAAFPDGQVSLDETVAEGDTVVARCTFTGTNTGKLLTLPLVTGKSTKFTRVEGYHLADGKIQDAWATYDRFTMLEQLGALPAPREAAAVA